MASTQEPMSADASDEALSSRIRLRSGDERELKQDIERRIGVLTGGGIQDLIVEVRAHQVELEGRCSTFYCKQLAQHAAMQLVPGEHIINRIEVVSP